MIQKYVRNLVYGVALVCAFPSQVHGEEQPANSDPKPSITEPAPTLTAKTAIAVAEKNQNFGLGSVSYGDNAGVFVVGEEFGSVGLNLENSLAKINLGYLQEGESKSTRELARVKLGPVFFGGEHQYFNDAKDKHVLNAHAGIDYEGFGFQATGDETKNIRAVGFAPLLEGILSVGGGGDFEGGWQANASYSHAVGDLANAGLWVRCAPDGFLDVRLQYGRKLPLVMPKLAFAAVDAGFNELSTVSDLTIPFDLGPFPLFSAEKWVGNETLDVGLDLRIRHGAKSYARGALNVGDYGPLNDVVLTAKWEYDPSAKVHTGIVGSQIGISDTGFKVWYECEKTEKDLFENRVMVSFERKF